MIVLTVLAAALAAELDDLGFGLLDLVFAEIDLAGANALDQRGDLLHQRDRDQREGQDNDEQNDRQRRQRRQGGPAATPGRYRAAIGKLAGDTFTALGEAQSFAVVPLAR